MLFHHLFGKQSVVGNDTLEVKYSKKIELDCKIQTTSLTLFEDVVISNYATEAEDTLVVDCPSYLLSFGNKNYFHLIKDELSQFELIKSKINDIVPVAISEGDLPVELPSYSKFIVENYLDNDPKKVINLSRYKKIKFSKLYCFYTFSSNHIYSKLEFTDIRGEFSLGYYRESMAALRSSLLKKYDKSTTTPNKKLYVTRKKENEVIRLHYEALTAVKYATSFDTSLESRKNAYKWASELDSKQLEAELLEVSRRYLDRDVEDYIESYFIRKGYLAISPGDLSVDDQISLFRSASHVAGLVGGGMTNTVFCQEGVIITILSPSNLIRGGGHIEMNKALFGESVLVIPRDAENNYGMPISGETPRTYTLEEFKEELENLDI